LSNIVELMKKETLIAIILGITAGVSIAIFLVANSKNRGSSGKKVITPATTPIVVATTQQELSPLTITSPENNTAVDADSIIISGKTQKGSLIILNSATAEKAFKAESNTFKNDFPLSIGENVIKVTAYFEKSSSDRILKIYNISNE